MRLGRREISIFGIHKGNVPQAVQQAERYQEQKLESAQLARVSFEKTVQEIKDRQLSCVFLSPHLDDVMLSAGGLIADIAASNPNVHLVTVFTSGGEKDKVDFATRPLLAGYPSARALFLERRKENRNAANLLGIHAVDLGFVDAAWRKRDSKPKGLRRLFNSQSSLYPLNTFFFGHVRRQDRKVLQGEIDQQIAHTLQQVSWGEKTVVFAPVGIKGLLTHVDHVISRDAAASLPLEVIYYAEYPYDVYATPAKGFTKQNNLLPVLYETKNDDLKRKAVLSYSSQIPLLFSKRPTSPVASVPARLPQEVYYIKSKG